MTINFSRKTSQIGFQISVPEGWRKNHRKIKIPAFSGYTILQMLDEGFQEQKHLWTLDDGNFVLDASKLPSSTRYFVDMEGVVDENVLKKFVYIKPAANRDNDDKNDKYWLESSIKQLHMLENIYNDLEIDDVNFAVMIDMNKMFALTIPYEVGDKIAAHQQLLQASASNIDREKLFRAAREYKRQEKISPFFDPSNFFRIIQRVTAKDFIRQYIDIDRPYDVGRIDQPEKYVGIIPQNINVQAITKLTLRNPIASGHLVFQREKYMEKLRLEFKRLI